MSLRVLLRTLCNYVVGRRLTAVFYVYCQRQQGKGREDASIRCFDAAHPPPPEIVEHLRHLGHAAGYFILRRRMKHCGARLLCLVEEGKLHAYGWTQGWRPFKRRLDWLTNDGVVLGPYWTAPSERGRGLYGRMLAHSIAVCPDRERRPLVIFARPDNTPSLRGTEKAGFLRLGVHEVNSWFFRVANRHRVIQEDRSLAEALRECREGT